MNSTSGYILKKYNINVGRQYFIDIPQMVGSTSLAQLFAELRFDLGVEIGTDQGEFAQVLCQANPNLRLFCVDPWQSQAYQKDEQPESNEDQSFFDNRYIETEARLSAYRATVIRKTSMDSLDIFEDNSLDFVYIDGNHDFLNVTQDIHFWLKKVRPGGIISGHDYVNYPFKKYNHVKKAVQAYVISYHLFPIFALMHTKKGMKRDRYRSWFLVKP